MEAVITMTVYTTSTAFDAPKFVYTLYMTTGG